jgi:hypothetical protein
VEFPSFRPRLPWWGADLQTLRNFLLEPQPDLGRFAAWRLRLPLADGSGDALSALLQEPPREAAGGRRPLAVLLHGLSGCEESSYMLASAEHLLGRGYPVLRLNLRGAGASRPLCRRQYHAGSSADLRAALAALDPALTRGGLALVGYSLGGNLLLKFLAESGNALPLAAAAAVSAPIDLLAASRRIRAPRNRPYQRYLLRRIQRESLASGAQLCEAEVRAIRGARTIYEFDDRFVAPRNGYAGAEEYYRENSALGFLAGIRIPTLVIHAADDPWIPRDAYASYPWHRNPRLVTLFSRWGGHVGFHGRGSRVPWHDRCIASFFERQR